MIFASVLRSGLILAGALLRTEREPPLTLRDRLAMVPVEGAPVCTALGC